MEHKLKGILSPIKALKGTLSNKLISGETYTGPKVTIYADGHAEKFTCSVCGRTYISRGKHDPGNLCRDCEAEKKAKVIGGPVGDK